MTSVILEVLFRDQSPGHLIQSEFHFNTVA